MAKEKRKGVRRKGIRWDYNYDGVFLTERWDAEDKRYWTRWRRRKEKRETEDAASKDLPGPQ